MIASSAFALQAVPTSVFLRGVAILLVVMNHTYWFHPAGGMNLLIFLSALSFARTTFFGSTGETVRYIPLYLSRFFYFAAPMMFAAFLIGKADWSQILFIENLVWGTREDVLFPMWYAIALPQMFLMICVLFLVLDLTPKLRRHPVVWSLGLTLLFVVVGLVVQGHLDPGFGRQPTYYLWLFGLAWVYWAVMDRRIPTVIDRLALWLVFAATAAVMIVIGEATYYQQRFFIFVVLITLLIFSRRIFVPRIIVQPVLLLAHAILYLFFFHMAIRYVFDHVLYLFDWAPLSFPFHYEIRFGFCVVVPVLIWALVTATTRVWRRRRPSAIGGRVEFAENPHLQR